MKLKKIVLAITATLIIILGAYWLVRKEHSQKKQIFYETAPVGNATITQHISATGTLKATDQFTIGSLLAGRIVEINVDDNDPVKKGQLLALIDNGIHDNAVKKTTAILAQARAEALFQEQFYKRQTALYNSGQIAPNLYEQYTRDYQAAQAVVLQREAELKQEEINYQNLFIRAPDDGVIIAKRIEIGQMITSQLQASVLFDIAHDLTDMEASVDVDEADVGRVEAGLDAEFTVDAFPKERFFATVDHVQYLAKIVDNIITYATILKVKNPNKKLRPGMTTNVTITVAHKENTLCVPNSALRINGYKLEEIAQKEGYSVTKKDVPQDDRSIIYDFVWVVREQNIIKTPVQLGIYDSKHTEIMRGLEPADLVITDLVDATQENTLLKNMFSNPGGIGKS